MDLNTFPLFHPFSRILEISPEEPDDGPRQPPAAALRARRGSDRGRTPRGVRINTG